MKTKITFLVLAFVLCLAAQLSANIICYDEFNYTAADTLNTQSGGAGWADDWTGDSYNSIDSPGLAYTNQNYHLAVNGNCVLTDVSNISHSWRYIETNGFMNLCAWSATANGWCFGKAGTTNWLSFIAQQMDTSNQYGGISLHEGGTWTQNEQVFIGYPGGTLKWWLKGGGKNASYDAVATTNVPATFLVLRIINFANVDATNTMDLWINPGLASEPTGNGDIHNTECNSTLFNRIRIASATSGFRFDELRFGETWADVAPVVPEPSLAFIGIILGMLFSRPVKTTLK